jgi:hypothetical protein
MRACCSNQTKKAGKFEKLCVASGKLQDRIWPKAPDKDELEDINKLILKDRQCYIPISYRNIFTNQDTASGYNPPIEKSPCDLPDTNQSFYSIDDNTSTSFALRNKNSVEQGLCISIPQPQPCPAIIDSNGTSWPTTEYGEKANGSCKNGYTGKPERYCFINVDNGITSFGDIINPCVAETIKK